MNVKNELLADHNNYGVTSGITTLNHEVDTQFIMFDWLFIYIFIKYKLKTIALLA